ncbi:hypothetical protein ABXV19_09870 [Pseudomonas alkylphenolica]|uniref:hypothetical protein n=1 Tax=Pseudomonas alkylphenolica TaxID=237609 RepID=UPI0033975BDF
MMIDAKTLLERMVQGEELMVQALEAKRRYDAAKGVLAADEIEQLRKQTEALFEAVQAYQLRVLGGSGPTLN